MNMVNTEIGKQKAVLCTPEYVGALGKFACLSYLSRAWQIVPVTQEGGAEAQVWEVRGVEIVGWYLECDANGRPYVRSYLVKDHAVVSPVPSSYPKNVLVEMVVDTDDPRHAIDVYRQRIAVLRGLFVEIRKKMYGAE